MTRHGAAAGAAVHRTGDAIFAITEGTVLHSVCLPVDAIALALAYALAFIAITSTGVLRTPNIRYSRSVFQARILELAAAAGYEIYICMQKLS